MTRLLRLFRFAGPSPMPLASDLSIGFPEVQEPSIRHLMNLPLPLALIKTSRFVHPEPTWGDRFDRVKFILRGLGAPQRTSEWFKVMSVPEYRNLLWRNPHILSKLQRPYLHRRLRGSGKLDALRFHYQFTLSAFAPEMLRRIAEPTGLLLSALDFGDDGKFSMKLYYSSRFEKEGELCIGLFDEQTQEVLFTLTFCLMESLNTGGLAMFLGGLQGHKFENQRERVVSLTRNMFGLRPKALLVFVLQRMAQIWRVDSITAVADAEHIYRAFGRRKEFNACYDEFWEECGGVKSAQGNYSLPTVPQTRNIAELSSNKRPLYRKRYAMLATVGLQIQQTIAPELEILNELRKVETPIPASVSVI